MAYVNSQAVAGRGTLLQALFGSPLEMQTIAEMKNISFSGSKYDLADVTNMQSGNFKEWLPTLADSGDLSFSGNKIGLDATQEQLITFFNNATLVTWQIIAPGTPNYITFKGYVVELSSSFPVDKEVTISGKIKITGMITNF